MVNHAIDICPVVDSSDTADYCETNLGTFPYPGMQFSVLLGYVKLTFVELIEVTEGRVRIR